MDKMRQAQFEDSMAIVPYCRSGIGKPWRETPSIAGGKNDREQQISCTRKLVSKKNTDVKNKHNCFIKNTTTTNQPPSRI
jgi:hypothetical protein